MLFPQIDPVKCAREFWPSVQLYAKEEEVLWSVWHNDETLVPAGNQLGKDFTAALAALVYFLTRHPCRIVTTSAKEDHLRVLWGEVGWFIDNCKVPLRVEEGGPLQVNHHDIRKVIQGKRCPISYLRGMVASADSLAAMGGHHADPKVPDGIPHTLFVADEASSVPDSYYQVVTPWAKRLLVIGNTWPCTNFFQKGVEGGDVPATDMAPGGKPRFFRKVIHITAEDSPNVRFARAQIAAGLEPTDEVLVPGVKGWSDYRRECALWDEHHKAVSHRAIWYKGGELFLFPEAWLNRANDLPACLPESRGRRKARGIGIDTGEGVADTSMTAVDEKGVIEELALKTPDTSVVEGMVVAFGKKHGCPPEYWCFDRGGGGKWVVDRLRRKGYACRTVAFGEPPQQDIRKVFSRVPFAERLDAREDRYTYLNRRAEMYGEASMLFDPSLNPAGFAVPREYSELRRQLAAMPKCYDEEGRLFLPPKQAKDPNDKDKDTLSKRLGCSPDRSDSLVLACFAMLHKPQIIHAGSVDANNQLHPSGNPVPLSNR